MAEPTEPAMAREMGEAPAVLERLAHRLLEDRASPFRPDSLLAARLRTGERLLFAACGSSRHAGLLGKYALAALAGLPSQIEQAHELSPLGAAVWQRQALCVAISQSGETEDTLAAAELARTHGCKVLAIVNVPNSTLLAQADFGLTLDAGPEVAVPATKTFLAQGLATVALAEAAARERGASAPLREALRAGFFSLGKSVAGVHRGLAGGPGASSLAEAVELVSSARQAIFVGQGPAVVAALEGALKLQEAAYVPARGFALGEIKHGPMAMLEPKQDVLVALVSEGGDAHRMEVGIGRLLGLGLPAILLGRAGDPLLARLATKAERAIVLTTGSAPPLLWPLLATAVLQQLALGCALRRKVEVDRPRYLVKQITTL